MLSVKRAWPDVTTPTAARVSPLPVEHEAVRQILNARTGDDMRKASGRLFDCLQRGEFFWDAKNIGNTTSIECWLSNAIRVTILSVYQPLSVTVEVQCTDFCLIRIELEPDTLVPVDWSIRYLAYPHKNSDISQAMYCVLFIPNAPQYIDAKYHNEIMELANSNLSIAELANYVLVDSSIIEKHRRLLFYYTNDPRYTDPTKLTDYEFYLDVMSTRYDLELRDVPTRYRTWDLCAGRVRLHPYSIVDTPEAHLNDNMYLEALKRNPLALRSIRDEHLNLKLCSAAINSDEDAWRYVPERFKAVLKARPCPTNSACA